MFEKQLQKLFGFDSFLKGQEAVIGKVLSPGSGRIHLRTSGSRRLLPSHEAKSDVPATAASVDLQADCCAEEASQDEVCCAEDGTSHTAGAGASDTGAKFMAFLKSSSAPAALDAYTKRIIAIALSVLAKCEPCLKTHLKAAREMGISQEEIEEAAWMAISFGGSPTMMFYNGSKDT